MRFSRILWLTGLWALAFWVPEGLARWWMPEWSPAQENARTMIPDREVGWLYKPYAEADTARLSGTFVANSLGLREREPGIKNKPRVLFLGDSFTWGWGVPNGVRYSDRLQLTYPQYQIINAGVNGYSTVQEALLLKKYYQRLMPDLVVLQIFRNDFLENLETQAAYKKPYLDWNRNFTLTHYPVPDDDEVAFGTKVLLWIANNTYFYRQLVIAGYVFLLKAGIDPGATSGTEITEPPAEDEIQGEGMRAALQLLYTFCKQENIPLVMISSDLSLYQIQIVNAFAEANDVPHYFLTESIFKNQQNFHLGDHAAHWNAYGHQLVADFIGPVIDEILRVH